MLRYVFCTVSGIAIGVAGTLYFTPVPQQAESAPTPIPAPAQKKGDTFSGTFKSAHDGDTFKIMSDGKMLSIRVWGIDAPELKQTCKKNTIDVPCGHYALEGLESLLQGDLISCENRGEDRKRIVAHCTVKDKDIGAYMIKEGLAFQDDRAKDAYDSELKYAQDRKKGLWGTQQLTPAQWRACNGPIPKELKRPDYCPVKIR